MYNIGKEKEIKGGLKYDEKKTFNKTYQRLFTELTPQQIKPGIASNG